MPARRKRRTPLPLDRERIGRAALARIESGGMGALSMRALAADLGCEAMSLYHHVQGIEGVLDAVVERLLDAISAAASPGGDPRRSLEAFGAAYLAQAVARPQAFPLLATRLLQTPNAMAVVGVAVRLLREMGLDSRAALRRARMLAAYLNGAGLAVAAWQRAPAGGRRIVQAAMRDPGLAPLSGAVNAAAVREDLEAGFRALLETPG